MCYREKRKKNRINLQKCFGLTKLLTIMLFLLFFDTTDKKYYYNVMFTVQIIF